MMANSAPILQKTGAGVNNARMDRIKPVTQQQVCNIGSSKRSSLATFQLGGVAAIPPSCLNHYTQPIGTKQLKNMDL